MAERKLHDTGRPGRAAGRLNWAFIGGIALILLGYVLLHDLLGGTLLAHNQWDSYTLQAMAWRDGRMALGRDYPYLELAVYHGDWYVSFPPVPSVVMLPLTFIFGADTPNNLVIMLCTLLCVVVAYLCFRKIGSAGPQAMFWAVFFVLGSNMLWMSTMGGVWFLAQGFNLLFCFAAVYCLQCKKKAPSLIFAALAVGCRPFSACLLPVLFACICVQAKRARPDKKFLPAVLPQLKYLAVPALIVCAYLWYNDARFGDPFEFGHNYLPEFSAAGSEQFHWKYIAENAYRLFLRPVAADSRGRLEFPLFDGFLFYIANPIFLLWFVRLARDAAKGRMTPQKLLASAGLAANMLMLLMHKTLGGWQFGARYTVDLIPFVLLYFLDGKTTDPGKPGVLVGCFALVFNIYGALYMNLYGGG
jgi:hypothetical protein